MVLVDKLGCLDRLLGNLYEQIVCSETHSKWNKKKLVVGQSVICRFFEANKVQKSKVVWKLGHDPVILPPLTSH